MVSPKQRFEEEFGELQREYLINQNADAAFADLAAWLEIYETYKDVEDFVGNKSEIARRAKEYIDTAKLYEAYENCDLVFVDDENE